MDPEGSLLCWQESATGPQPEPNPRPCVAFVTNRFFYDKPLAQTSGWRTIPLDRDCLFSIFATTLHIWGSSPPSATRERAMP